MNQHTQSQEMPKRTYQQMKESKPERTARRTRARTLFRPVPTNAPRVHREELKYLDAAFGTSAASTTGLVTLCNGVAVGDTAITREGRQCYWKSFEIHGRLSSLNTDCTWSRADIYVIWDSQPGAAVPAMTDLFVQSIAGSPHNLNYRERFKTLAHRTWVLGTINDVASESFAAGPVIHPVDIYGRINLRTTYKGDTAAIGDIATGAMYVVTLGDAGAMDGGVFYITTRMRFSER